MSKVLYEDKEKDFSLGYEYKALFLMEDDLVSIKIEYDVIKRSNAVMIKFRQKLDDDKAT